MIFLNLEKHNITFEYDFGLHVSESEIGKWLLENHIDYKVVNFNSVYPRRSLSEPPLLGISEMQFYNEEDVVAFKLRWAN